MIRLKITESLKEINKKRVSKGLKPFKKGTLASAIFPNESRVTAYNKLDNFDTCHKKRKQDFFKDLVQIKNGLNHQGIKITLDELISEK